MAAFQPQVNYSGGQAPDGWPVPQAARAKHAQSFAMIDTGRTGFLTGTQARTVLVQSGLPQQTLAAIWNLADVDVDGRLTCDEFILAMVYIEAAKAGRPVPPTLPPEMVPPAFRKAASRTGSISGPPGVMPASGEWAIPHPSKVRYSQMFAAHDVNKSGFITGVQARGILVQSALPQDILAKIWSLCDVTLSGRLTCEEFILAMHLIDMAKSGIPIPPVTPPELVPPSHRALRTPPTQTPVVPAPPAPVVPTYTQPPVPPPPVVPPAAAAPVAPATVKPEVASDISDNWAIPQATRIKHSQSFAVIDVNKTGYMTGTQARNVLVQSGLPQQMLAAIWNLADIDVDGRLTCDEFIIAMFYIEAAKAGKALPPTLPPEMVPPAFRKQSASRSGSVSESTGYDGPPPPPAMMITEWAVPQPSKLKYTQVFNTHDRSRSGFLTGVQARGILVQSQLPQDILAKIWSLCDVTLSGKLSCEEFVLAMHLIDMVKAGDAVPNVLPPELLPPCHRRRKSSVSSVASGGTGPGAAAANISDEPGSPVKMASGGSFEDRRKENFEKGQAVLDRKRQALLDQQKREQDERERKEREEQAKREKIRIEMERKRQEEVERQIQKQREIEAEKEEARRKQLEQREAARREMERQRMLEWETQRMSELQVQKQKTMEYIAALKSKKKNLMIECEKVNTQFQEAKDQVFDARQKVAAGKAVIDDMRGERDAKMRQLNMANAQKKSLSDKEAYVQREEARITREMKAALNLQQGVQEAPGSDAAKFALQNKQLAISQLKSQLGEAEKDREQKIKDSDKNAQQLNQLKESLEEIKVKVRELQNNYHNQLKEATQVKTKLYEKQFEAAWDEEPEPPAAPGIVSQTTGPSTLDVSGKSEYRVLYQFDARNEDELNLTPGDTIWIIPNPSGEEGWLQGQNANGKIGWFPEAYVEPASSVPAAPVTPVSTETKVVQKAEKEEETPKPPFNSSGDSNEYISIYPWVGKESNHLSFNINDVIKVTEKQETGDWWYGESKSTGAFGWFPAAYVNPVSGQQAPLEYYVSLYPFESQEPGDLAFDAGVTIQVVKKDGEWWTGELTDGRTGVFPSNYVRDADPSEIPKPSTVKEPSTPAPRPKTAVDRKESTPLTEKQTSGSRRSSTSSIRSTDSPKSKGKGKGKKPEVVMVMAPYKATGPEQLNLEKGQLIQIRKKNSSGWWEGETQQKGKKKEVGWFPATYVKPLTGGGGSSGAPSASSSPRPESKSAPVSSSESSGEKVVSIYPFKAQHDDELSFEANEVIRILSKDDPTWWKGMITASGATGLFPSNHVQEYKCSLYSMEGYHHDHHHRHHQDVPSEYVEDEDDHHHDGPADLQVEEESYTAVKPEFQSMIRENKRQQGIQELIGTEEAYVTDLKNLRHVFKEPLLQTKAISVRENDIIFSNWDTLIQVNEKFLKSLKKKKRESIRCGSSVINSIGSILSSGLQTFETPYVHYCSRLTAADKLIERRVVENYYFSDQLKRFSADPRASGLNLGSHLLKPMQRITRYPLLIRKILEYTDETHEDYPHLKQSLDISESLCTKVNEGRRSYENQERLSWISSHVILTSDDPSIDFNSHTNFCGPRELLHMGSLTKVNSGKELMGFLFNDFLLLTQPSKEIGKVSNLFASEKALSSTYKLYKRPYFLNQLQVNNTGNHCDHNTTGPSKPASRSSTPSLLSSGSVDVDPTVFSVTINLSDHYDHHPQNQQHNSNSSHDTKIIVFKAISSNDKVFWTKNLSKAINLYNEKLKSIRRVPKGSNHIMRFSLPSAIAGRLLVTVVEASGLTSPSHKSSMTCFFVASVGQSSSGQKDHMQIEESPVVKCHIPYDHHHSLTSGSSVASLRNQNLPLNAKWNHSMRFLLMDEKNAPEQHNRHNNSHDAQSLKISVYEKDPFAPDRYLGSVSLTIDGIRQELKTSNARPLLKQANLMTGGAEIIINRSNHKMSTKSCLSLTSSDENTMMSKRYNSIGSNPSITMTPLLKIKVDLLNSCS